MNAQLQGLFYIILGSVVVFASAGDLLFKLAFAAMGLYMIYTGLRMRNSARTVFFSFHNIYNRFR